MAQIVEVPAGQAEEAMEGREVLELGELRGLQDAGEGTAAGTRIQAQDRAQKERKLGPVKQDWKASRKGANEFGRISGIQAGLTIFH